MIPRVPFCAAEAVVDYDNVDNVVLEGRKRIEAYVWKWGGKRLALSVRMHGGAPSPAAASSVAHSFAHSCISVYMAGYDQVIDELAALRGSTTATDSGNRDDGYKEIQALARQAAGSYQQSVINYFGKVGGDLAGELKIEGRARQLLHNVTLEIVGRVLNLGRNHAATGGARPVLAAAAALYAMRSEQLDRNTCGPCDSLHGYVAQVGSPSYWEHTPPNDCLGRGRCRGIWVYADALADLRIPGGQERLPIGPEQPTLL